MSNRIVRADILTSDAVDALTWPAEVFYRRLMSIVDDFGRGDARPTILRSSLYPLKLHKVAESDIVKWLGECSNTGLVRCYTVEGKDYLEILKFRQQLRIMKSRFPDPSDSICNQMISDDSRRIPETKQKQKQETKEVFRPPSKDDVIDLMRDILDDFTAMGEGSKFVDYYDSVGWKVGKNKMKDWKAAVRNWIGRMSDFRKPPMPVKTINYLDENNKW